MSLKSRVILLFFEKFFFWSWVFEHGVSEFAGFGHFSLDLVGWMDWNGPDWRIGLEMILQETPLTRVADPTRAPLTITWAML